jgi:chromosome segregation ATPase
VSEQSDRVAGMILAEIENLKSAPSDEANALAVDLQEAVHLIFSRATAREAERRKKVEHDAIVPLCRAAKEKFDKLNAEAEKQNELLFELRRKADQAESKLNIKRDARPNPWPTAKEISDWEKACAELEDSLEAARAEVRGANARRGELTAELLRARNEFTNLMFRERNARPRQAELLYAGISLSAVR